MSLNVSVLMGRITHELELRKTNNGTSVVNFTIAVDRKYQASGEERKTDFIDCVAWRSTADFITTYFKKGAMIAVEGEIQTDSYTDKDGNKRKKTEILVNNASFCGSKTEGNNSPAENTNTPQGAIFAATGANTEFTQLTPDDDLPF